MKRIILAFFVFVLIGFGLWRLIMDEIVIYEKSESEKSELDRELEGLHNQVQDVIEKHGGVIVGKQSGGFTVERERHLTATQDDIDLFKKNGPVDYIQPFGAYGLNEKKGVWNRIRVDEYGYVICSLNEPSK